MTRLHINVSKYDNRNPDMVCIKNNAETKSDYWEMMHDCDEQFFNPAMNFWIERFGHRNDVRLHNGHPNQMWGVFNGVSDPSICVELDANQNILTELKLAAIDFGEWANQDNVHIARSLGHNINQPFGDLLDEHGTLEIGWLVKFGSLRDPRVIHSIANRVGVRDLSVTSEGWSLLIYTYGNQTRRLPGIPEHFNLLAEALGKTSPIAIGLHQYDDNEQQVTNIMGENVWCMELINFGRTRGENGATHTYEEARRLLGA